MGHEVACLGDEHGARPLEESRDRNDLVQRAGYRTRLGQQHEAGPVVEQRFEVAEQDPAQPARPPVGHLDPVRDGRLPGGPPVIGLRSAEDNAIPLAKSERPEQAAHQLRVVLADRDLIVRPVRIRIPEPGQVGPQIGFRRRVGSDGPRPQGAGRPHAVKIKQTGRRRIERFGHKREWEIHDGRGLGAGANAHPRLG